MSIFILKKKKLYKVKIIQKMKDNVTSNQLKFAMSSKTSQQLTERIINIRFRVHSFTNKIGNIFKQPLCYYIAFKPSSRSIHPD